MEQDTRPKLAVQNREQKRKLLQHFHLAKTDLGTAQERANQQEWNSKLEAKKAAKRAAKLARRRATDVAS